MSVSRRKIGYECIWERGRKAMSVFEREEDRLWVYLSRREKSLCVHLIWRKTCCGCIWVRERQAGVSFRYKEDKQWVLLRERKTGWCCIWVGKRQVIDALELEKDRKWVYLDSWTVCTFELWKVDCECFQISFYDSILF